MANIVAQSTVVIQAADSTEYAAAQDYLDTHGVTVADPQGGYLSRSDDDPTLTIHLVTEEVSITWDVP